ncbi:PhzF family phenazine biosynthesis protein [Angustibacter luteus]|uniref:PhzF family phenazine biosynthesis protein n=1 Tax=Angustibacter luteus TaxID=658456 RepID=A0ABW1JJW3_9ACTN
MDPVALLDFDVVDVFTATPFAGNALAVVHGSAGLATRQLQAIAREFHLSETAFPTPLGDNRYRLRIFTPSGELPFAGHPSVGAAWVLRERGELVGTSAQQECLAGTVRLELGPAGGSGGPVWLTGAAPTLRGEVTAAELALALDAVGLAPDDLAGLPSLVAGTGLDFGYLLVRPPALERAVPQLRSLTAVRQALSQRLGCDVGGVSVVAWPLAGRPDAGAAAVPVRVFTDDIGAAAEDPATGSAALGLQVALVALGLLAPDGASVVELSQGVQLSRPSTLRCRVEASGGVAVRCHVGGQVVPVARGSIRVPPAGGQASA